MKKTNEELEQELRCIKITERERAESNRLYAEKRIQHIVDNAIKIVLGIIVASIMALIIKSQL
ncbi:MAG: hypothetical protein BWY74_00775 [Firmicutes bacterium ADurb.Bin419]|nr:MAG: hypothetical protein BWY74_00775 [Firmicutes bacterium ADurb.Bin419]